MTDQIEAPARRHGKTGVSSVTHHPELHLHTFETEDRVTAPLPTSWDGTNGLTKLTMLGNGPDPDNPPAYPDGVGDCVRVSEQNGRKFAAYKGTNEAGEQLWEPGFRPPHTPWTVDGYFDYGLAMGWHGVAPAPADQPDFGCDPGTYAKWMFKVKQAEVIAEVDLSDPAEAMNRLRQAAIDFNGVAITVNLTKGNMQEFDEGEPFTPGPSAEEGHGLWYAKWDPTYDHVATWAEVYPAQPAWLPSVITSAWVYGTKELFANKGYNAEAIVAAAEALLEAEVTPAVATPPALAATDGLHAELEKIEGIIGHLENILVGARTGSLHSSIVLKLIEELLLRFR